MRLVILFIFEQIYVMRVGQYTLARVSLNIQINHLSGLRLHV
jgi:hypothetical protein